MSAEFIAAVVSGDTGRVRQNLTADTSLARLKDSEGAMALHYAALHGRQEIVSLLLECCAEINARDLDFGQSLDCP